MTAGLEGDDPTIGGDPTVFDAMWASPDWVRHILGRELVRAPGTSFAYSSASSHLLSAIVAESTGRSTLDFARKRLFGPLGIRADAAFEPVLGPDLDHGAIDRFLRSAVAWPVDPQGYSFGGAFLRLSARDLAKLGFLYLNEGSWDGEQVLPADYVRNSTTPQAGSTHAEGEYGWQWWVQPARGHHAYFARGYGGQVLHVVPDLDLVTVVTADLDVLIPASTVGLVAQVVVPAVAD
jgi:CubicO group peptidase (beta-lactamase class C family)